MTTMTETAATYTVDGDWLTDASGNRASIEYFGSEVRATEALSSLSGCRNCTNSWHTCNTTHCRAGWVVHLAGEPGYALERFHGTALAAQLIYRGSGYQINPGRFYDNNNDAMDDMRRLADTKAGA